MSFFTLDLEQLPSILFGFITGIVATKLLQDRKELNSTPTEESPVREDVKMVICVRTDLKMGKGKICAQVGHGVLAVAETAARKRPKMYARYKSWGQKKICVKVNSEEELETVYAKARSLNLVSQIIADAGHTQILAGSQTVCAVLGPESLVNKVTGEYKLL